MKITIDGQQCLKRHISTEEALVMLALKMCHDIHDVVANLEARGIITGQGGQFTLSRHWSDVLDEVLLASSGDANDEQRLLNLAKQMRDLYPRGKMPGTPYFYRCNNREVVLKLKKFFTTYGNYPDDKILDATRRYVASFQGNYKYLPLIKYFILKDKLRLGEDGRQHVSQESPLATYLENKDDSTLATASDDWLATVRN